VRRRCSSNPKAEIQKSKTDASPYQLGRSFCMPAPIVWQVLERPVHALASHAMWLDQSLLRWATPTLRLRHQSEPGQTASSRAGAVQLAHQNRLEIDGMLAPVAKTNAKCVSRDNFERADSINGMSHRTTYFKGSMGTGLSTRFSTPVSLVRCSVTLIRWRASALPTQPQAVAGEQDEPNLAV